VIEWLIEKLKPIRYRCLGILEGNHELTVRQKYHFDIVGELVKALDTKANPINYLGYILADEGIRLEEAKDFKLWITYG